MRQEPRRDQDGVEASVLSVKLEPIIHDTGRVGSRTDGALSVGFQAHAIDEEVIMAKGINTKATGLAHETVTDGPEV